MTNRSCAELESKIVKKSIPPIGILTEVTSGTLPWSTMAGVFVAVLLGIFLLAGTGLVGAETLHNAAHDARHAMGFPCH